MEYINKEDFRNIINLTENSGRDHVEELIKNMQGGKTSYNLSGGKQGSLKKLVDLYDDRSLPVYNSIKDSYDLYKTNKRTRGSKLGKIRRVVEETAGSELGQEALGTIIQSIIKTGIPVLQRKLKQKGIDDELTNIISDLVINFIRNSDIEPSIKALKNWLISKGVKPEMAEVATETARPMVKKVMRKRVVPEPKRQVVKEKEEEPKRVIIRRRERVPEKLEKEKEKEPAETTVEVEELKETCEVCPTSPVCT